MAAGCPIKSASHCEGPRTEKVRRFGALQLAAALLMKPGNSEIKRQPDMKYVKYFVPSYSM